ncbi:MAG: OmpA family protein [Rhodospirillales bacterium]|nr:OmpA family protein [Rhodospirillales bacterium]
MNHQIHPKSDHLIRAALTAAALLAVSACAEFGGYGYKTAEVEASRLQASEFNRNLYRDYLDLADAERAEYDWKDAHYFAGKALAAAQDEEVGPESIYERRLPAGSVAELRGARNRLVEALDRGAAVKAPGPAAAAQTGFDCWLQEQEEDHQPDDIAACRETFELAMAQVDEALGPRYTVYFDFDSAKLSGDAEQVLKQVAEAAKASKDAAVLISGHADRAGSEAYNLALSQRRVSAIRRLLLSAGVKAEQIGTAEYGETAPAVHTLDATPEARNRRVEINVVQ